MKRNLPLAANLAVFTTKEILTGKESILLVCHDSEDGAWQFLPNKKIIEANVAVVALAEIIELDNSVLGVLDLPEGWTAQRKNRASAWEKKPEVS